MTDACFVSWPLRADSVDDLRAVVASTLAGADGSGVDAVLPLDGVATVSLFHHDRDGDGALVWYVEHAETDKWDDPAAAIREQSPLFPEVAPFLASSEPTVVADASSNVVRLVHASLPGRPNEYADRTGGIPTVVSANDPDGDTPDVVPLRLTIASGFGTLFARLFAGISSRLADDGPVERTFESWTEPILAAEEMYTESLLLEWTDANYALWWYMESGGMEQVGEAYYESDSTVARVSEYVLGWVLERPERALGHPAEASDFELLAHAVDAERE